MNKAKCDRCGFVYPANKLKKTWDGLWVCPKDWEPRHPQDFAGRAKPESLPEITRPDSYIFLTSISGETMTILETVTPSDLTISTAPTTPTIGTFLSPRDVTSSSL